MGFDDGVLNRGISRRLVLLMLYRLLLDWLGVSRVNGDTVAKASG